MRRKFFRAPHVLVPARRGAEMHHATPLGQCNRTVLGDVHPAHWIAHQFPGTNFVRLRGAANLARMLLFAGAHHGAQHPSRGAPQQHHSPPKYQDPKKESHHARNETHLSLQANRGNACPFAAHRLASLFMGPLIAHCGGCAHLSLCKGKTPSQTKTCTFNTLRDVETLAGSLRAPENVLDTDLNLV